MCRHLPAPISILTRGLRVSAPALSLLLAGALFAGCGAASTLSMQNGERVEGRVVGQTDGYLVVETKAGTELVLPERDVKDIDYPGNVALITGLVLTSLGALVVDSDPGPGVLMMLGGIPTAATGGLIFLNSQPSLRYDSAALQRRKRQDLAAFKIEHGLTPDQGEPEGPVQHSAPDDPTESTSTPPNAKAPTPAATDGTTPQARTRRASKAQPERSEKPDSPPPTTSTAPSSPVGWCVPAATQLLSNVPPVPLSEHIAAVEEAATSCVISCLGQPSTCGPTCTAENTKIELECAACFTNAAKCRVFTCMDECSSTPEACERCISTRCEKDFALCSGL